MGTITLSIPNIERLGNSSRVCHATTRPMRRLGLPANFNAPIPVIWDARSG